MQLWKYRTNNQTLLRRIPAELREATEEDLVINNADKTLGIYWNLHTNTFRISTPEVELDEQPCQMTGRILGGQNLRPHGLGCTCDGASQDFPPAAMDNQMTLSQRTSTNSGELGWRKFQTLARSKCHDVSRTHQTSYLGSCMASQMRLRKHLGLQSIYELSTATPHHLSD